MPYTNTLQKVLVLLDGTENDEWVVFIFKNKYAAVILRFWMAIALGLVYHYHPLIGI